MTRRVTITLTIEDGTPAANLERALDLLAQDVAAQHRSGRDAGEQPGVAWSFVAEPVALSVTTDAAAADQPLVPVIA